ncbi:MAG TPA: aminotransferase class V-fold PLP-dependent enzyme [Jiangellales bacterium]|nr:aminotransferase class V-fold PLP-dependent enzyme [Jiangellales bacterium]
MTIDVAALRADTPGCGEVVHLNNAGASLPPRVVTETVVAHLRREAQTGGYEAAAEAEERVEAVYRSVAALLHADPADVALVDNATRAWQSVAYGLPLAAGDRILVDRAQYSSSVVDLLRLADRHGASVEVVQDDEGGQVDVADLRRRLGQGSVALVSLTHVPTHGGLVNPAAEVGAATRAAGVPLLLDACQSAGQIDLDVEAIGCDALSATGRKYLRGPRGTGFLWVRPALRRRLDPPWPDLRGATWTGDRTFDLRDDARVFETWERNLAALLGLGAAVEYARGVGVPAIEERVRDLAGDLRTMLDALPGVTTHDTGRQRCGIVVFRVAGVDAAEVRDSLRAHGVNTSVTDAAGSRWALVDRGLPDLVRASVHAYNTEQDLAALCDALPGARPA